jgi:hypothetical protein
MTLLRTTLMIFLKPVEFLPMCFQEMLIICANWLMISPKKIYAADTGIRCLFAGFRDKGSLFEN